MLKNHNAITMIGNAALLFGVILIALIGCAREQPAECPDPPPAAKKKPVQPQTMEEGLEIISGGQVGRSPDDDWCQTCVMGPKGWASCQTVFSETKNETRDSVKTRSREKACGDAGFEKGMCPDKSIMGVLCKGDPKPSADSESAKNMRAILLGTGSANADEKVGAAADKKQAEAKTETKATGQEKK